MPTNFVQELQWRGLLHDIMPETETFLLEKSSRGYIGFDPTADSLHIGSLVQIMILMHFPKKLKAIKYNKTKNISSNIFPTALNKF